MLPPAPGHQAVDHVLQDPRPTPSSIRAKKSVMKALNMSIIHVLAFVISWTPYTVMATW